MNLTKYFYDNFDYEQCSYYARRISDSMYNKYKGYLCEFLDNDEIIIEWKRMLYPSNDLIDDECLFYFYILSFYLYKHDMLYNNIQIY